MIPLNKTSDMLVLDLINKKNPGADLPLNKITLGTPTARDATDDDSRNTSLEITAKKNSGYIGSQNFTYDRLFGQQLFLNVTAYLDVKTPKTTNDLLSQLNQQYGLQIKPEDINATSIPDGTNAPVENPEDPDPVPVDHTITFKDDCYAYLGSIPVKIGPKPQVGERLSLVVTKTQLDGLKYPDVPVTGKGQAYIYSYGIDASAIAPFLNVQATGVVANDTAFATELNKIVPELWVAEDDSKPYNLKDANVIYVGSTTDDGTVTGAAPKVPVVGANTAYTHVMLLTLDDTKCSNFTGTMFLHFNA